MATAEYLLDTNVLIYATLLDDPRHKVAWQLVHGNGADGPPSVCVSAQNLAEMWPALTGPKTDPPDTPEIAQAKIASILALPNVMVLPVDRDAVRLAAHLCHRYGIVRRRYYDAQIAAVMIQNGIRRIYTENNADLAAIREVEAINPFA